MIGALVTNLVISQRIERNRYDNILPRISNALVSSFGQSSFYERLLEQCRQILSADLCSLFLVESHDNLKLKAIVGELDNTARQKLTDFGYDNYESSKGLTPWILRESRAFNVRNYPDLGARSDGNHLGKWDEIVYHGRPQEEFKSLYSIPLIVGDNKIGVLKVENKNVPPYYFTESDEALFDLIGRLIAIGAIYDNEKYLGAMIRAAELGFLAAGISHEFYNYLHLFLGIVDNVCDLCKGNEPAIQMLNDLNQEIETAEDVINHFRNIRNRQESTDPFDPDVLVNDMLGLIEQRFKVHQVTVEYKNEGVDQLNLNPADFQTILVNLLQNAFESIQEKGPRGSVSVELKKILPERFSLIVADSGKGITADEEKHIFLPFFTTKSPSGTGFGLFGIQRIVNALGGKIKITTDNQLGGATFEIILPTSPKIKGNKG